MYTWNQGRSTKAKSVDRALSCILGVAKRDVFWGLPNMYPESYDCFLDLRLFNSPNLRRLGLCYCCQARTLETVLGGNTALTRWWTARIIDCFTLLLARHLADVSCYMGPSMPSGICMEIHTEIVQKRKKKPSHNKGTPRQPHVYL